MSFLLKKAAHLYLQFDQRLMMIEEGEIEGEEQGQVPPINRIQSVDVGQGKRPTKKKDMIGMLKNNQVRLNYLRESLKYFTPIKKNIYLDRKRKIPKNDEMEPCFCRPKSEEESIEHTNISYNCGERCLNRMMSTECDDDTCNCGEHCANRKFQKHQYAYVYPMPQGGKGWGLCAGEKIPRGSFIMQYIGQFFSTNSQFGKARVKQYSKSTCTYLMKTSKGEVIDPTYKGNLARFINHSCQPNCITQKWNVLGEICIGIFALRDIEEEEELTFDYQFDVYSTPLTKCLCGAKKCKGYLGLRPTDITAEEWNERLEDMTCEICEKNYEDDDIKLIICDQCNKGFHIYCLTPALDKIPQEAFFCKQCQTLREQEKDRVQKEARQKLIQTKKEILQNEKRRMEEESSSEDDMPFDQDYEKFFNFIKKKEREATKMMIKDNKQEKASKIKIKDKVDKADKGEMDIEGTPKKTGANKKELLAKRVTPVSKKKDEFYEVTKKAIDKFQNYLQKNQKFYQQLNNFGLKKQQKTQDEKKTLHLNKIQMQLILKSNFILFQKIGAQIYFDINGRNSADYFLRNIEVIVIGNEDQISMFQQIVSITNEIINELQVQMGITEAYIPVPAIFLKRLLGPGHSVINSIEKLMQVAIYYHRIYLNEECYPLEVTCRMLIKGGKENIIRAYEQIKRRLSTFEIERLYFNPYEIKTVVNNMPSLKRKTGIAEFRISRESPFKEINHPFYYIQQKNKQITIIGTRVQVQRTHREIMSYFEEPNRKEEYNFNISLYLAQPNQKSVLLTVKNQLERDIPSIKMMIFDPTPPRKNMTLSFLGTRENRQKAKEYLFKRLDALNKQGKFLGNLQAFQDQMNYQMTKYYFKYMQNTLLTKDTAFMKSWDILNIHYYDENINYMWKSVKKQLMVDYETLLYACFVLKQKIILKIQQESKSNLSILQEVFQVVRQNVNRILNVYNVNNTFGLKNYTSCIDSEQAKKAFKDQYPHVIYIKSEVSHIHLEITAETLENKIKDRELSYFEKKVFRKYKNLLALLEQDRIKSKEKDKDEDKKKDKYK